MRSENAFRVKSYYQTRLFFEKLIQKLNYDKYRSPFIKGIVIFVAHNALALTRIVSLNCVTSGRTCIGLSRGRPNDEAGTRGSEAVTAPVMRRAEVWTLAGER